MAKMLNATIAKILDIGQFLDIGDVHHFLLIQHICGRKDPLIKTVIKNSKKHCCTVTVWVPVSKKHEYRVYHITRVHTFVCYLPP